jgi:hypothetical protein
VYIGGLDDGGFDFHSDSCILQKINTTEVIGQQVVMLDEGHGSQACNN